MRFLKNNTPVCLVMSMIAASASSAIAQRDSGHIDTFAIDLLDHGAVVETQHAAPVFGSTTDALPTLSQPMAFQIPVAENTDREGGFEALVSNNAGNHSSTQGIYSADKVAKPATFVVVPLPSAAIAGLGMICGLAGVRYMRSRR